VESGADCCAWQGNVAKSKAAAKHTAAVKRASVAFIRR
jgi:hypothetical protein